MASKLVLLAFVLNVGFAAIATGASVHSRPRMNGLSAKRLAGESYQQALQRSRVLSTRANPIDLQVPLEDLDIQQIPELASVAELEQYFEFVRDGRFMETETEFPRRLTWLYPDDGCFARAEVGANELIGEGFVAPMKVFAFGNLAAETDNHVGGVVFWWYHNVPIFRVGQVAYVIDPALNSRVPLTLNEWNTAIGGDSTTVNFSICLHETFGPGDDCHEPVPLSEGEAEAWQELYLQPEYDRQVQLGRDPEEVLGDNPPWSVPEAKLKH